MHRPVRETQQDRERELNCIRSVAESRGIPYTMFPPMYPVDAAFYNPDGSVRAFVEHKHRKVNHDKYRDVAMTASKYWQGISYAALYGVPFVVVWDFLDGVYWKQVPDGLKCKLFHGHTGSKDRGDIYDKEPVVMIPTSGMRKALKCEQD